VPSPEVSLTRGGIAPAGLQHGWRAFSDGFGWSLAGGAVYTLGVSYLYPDDASLAWLRVLSIAIALGVFEMWRATGKRTISNIRRSAICVLLTSFGFWFALGEVAQR